MAPMEEHRLARIALSQRAEPGTTTMASALSCGALDGGAVRAAEAALTHWRSRGIDALIPGDAGWPTQLGDLAIPPAVLYVTGAPLRSALLRSVAIVGARDATPLGRRIAAQLAAELAAQGFCIVSGGAFGIDAAAHEGALAAGGHTVAVLASGVDVDSPRGNRGILQAIRERGTIVSELPPGTPPARHRFVTRNRLIAALAPGSLVVQAASRSGALATAHRAGELNRIVMAVPGAVGDEAHAGCHGLIRDHEAVLVTSSEQVRELLEPIGLLDTGAAETGGV